MWSCKTVFASCYELNFHAKPDVTVSRIDDECKRCAQLFERLQVLHKSGAVGQVYVQEVDGDEEENEGDEGDEGENLQEEKLKCHQVWLSVNEEEKYDGPEKFPLTQKRKLAQQQHPLPHQTRLKHRFTPRDWNNKYPAVQIMWMLGNGKTKGVLDALLTSNPPPQSCFIVCPKSLLGMWAQNVRKYVLPQEAKCRVVVCGFFYFNMLITSPSETPYTVREVTRSCVVVDENQAYRNLTEKRQADLDVLREVNHLFLLSGTPITKASDVEALSLTLGVESPANSSPESLSTWVSELRSKGQVDFYNPELMQPSYHKDHFPEVERKTVKVPMSWSQLAATLMCQRKYLHSPSNQILGDAKVDSYYVLSRGLSNSVTLKDGSVISPKRDRILEHVREQGGRHAITSEYLENGVFPVAAALRVELGKGVELIDGGQSASARTRAVDAYNSGKSHVFCFSTCGRDGLDLMRTDTFHSLEVQRNEILAGQASGRVIRFGSHPKGGKVLVLSYVSTLPQKLPEKGSHDWRGLHDIFKELYASEEFKEDKAASSRSQRALSRKMGKTESAARTQQAADRHAAFWAKEKEHVEQVLNDIQKSLAHFGITESVEEHILRTRAEAVREVQPFVDALIVAGVPEGSELYKSLGRALHLNLRSIKGVLAPVSTKKAFSHDLETFLRVAEACKAKGHVRDFVEREYRTS